MQHEQNLMFLIFLTPHLQDIYLVHRVVVVLYIALSRIVGVVVIVAFGLLAAADTRTLVQQNTTLTFINERHLRG